MKHRLGQKLLKAAGRRGAPDALVIDPQLNVSHQTSVLDYEWVKTPKWKQRITLARASTSGQVLTIFTALHDAIPGRITKSPITRFDRPTKPSTKFWSLDYAPHTSIDFEKLERVIKLTVVSIKQAESQEPRLSESDLLRRVSSALAAKANAESDGDSTEEGWQALLVTGLEYKSSVLESEKFKSTGEVAQILRLGEAAVRRRIRDGKLFALKAKENDDYRIPVWALGMGIEGTKALVAARVDAWALYHFMTTSNGSLNGMRPFELLLPAESLTLQQLGRRSELAQYLGIHEDGPLLAVVLNALVGETAEELHTS